ncbi:MAG: tail fiber protein, partial [Bacteroidales bacterium]|nr:tail fiber protein [Bacteroidales bacterium]
HTDISGCFGITVGHGQRDDASLVANYTDINFAAVYYWMKIEVNEGGTYREVSFAQLPSSPYSEVAHNAMATPTGNIAPFAGPAENIPDGWMLCDGRELSRTEYQRLYDVIGVAWGTGDGATTFNIPDLRGMFLRGVAGENLTNDADADSRLANNHGGNSGNNVGSYQGDAIRNITGSIYCYGGFDGNTQSGALYSGNYGVRATGGDGGNRTLNFDASSVVPVGSDNRPKNVYVNYIIKY